MSENIIDTVIVGGG
ncbi:hypothetical protein, partial [Tsukamurella strandjordii]